jgi:acyl dehydratase
MTGAVRLADIAVGTQLPSQVFRVDRAGLVRYAGASGDFNVIHWNQRVATSVGLPDVIAHGMLTMALAGRVLTDWVGDPGAVVEFGTKFTRPVVVPDDADGATVEVTGKITAVNDDGTAQVSLTVMCDGVTVLGNPRAVVRLSQG